jgi:septal ring factor EnvC (AmiA/AmiB activator)
MKHDAKLTNILKSVLLLLAFCLSAMICIGVGTAEAAPTQITMSTEQWNQLKNQTNLLQAKLNLLESALTTQKGTSKELLTQLAEAKMQLQETQKALNSSKNSLATAKESLKNSEELYKTLTEQMESERRKARRIKHQRNVYAGCAVFAIAFAVVK